MSNQYPHLFEPIVLGKQFFRNRIFNSPTGVAIQPERYSASYYERKAIGGAASVCVGDACPDINGRQRPSHMNFWNMDDSQSVTDIANCIKRHGAVASVELIHCGNASYFSQALGAPLLGPIDDVSPFGGEIHAMTEEQIEEVIESHARAALYAKSQGYGMVTVHGGHGWLITQFLLPSNNRKDKWGGSIENRARLAIAIVDRIHQVCGRGFPVEIRIVGDEVYEGGYHIEEGIKQAQLLSGHADLIHVSTGSHEVAEVFTVTHPSMFLEDGCNVHFAAEIKKHVKDTPIATVGALTDPEQLEEIIATGQADVVEMARGLICDPDLPKKLQTGRADEVRKCMRCLHCFSFHMASNIITCSINPEIGHEYEMHTPVKREVSKKVLVVGGGMAGMEAALEAARDGHKVVLCEKADQLGGVLRCERNAPFKKHLDEYIQQQAMLIERDPNIEVRLNCEVTPEVANQIAADAIIACLGSVPVKPPIPGIDNPNVFGAIDVYSDPSLTGDNVVIIGGGLVGIELSVLLGSLGKKVTIVEQMPNLSDGGEILHSLACSSEMKRYGVQVSPSTKVTGITEQGVEVEFLGVAPDESFRFGMPAWPLLETQGTRTFLADTVVYSVGMKPLWEPCTALRDCAPEFFQVGDCCVPRNIHDATSTAHYVARDLGRL